MPPACAWARRPPVSACLSVRITTNLQSRNILLRVILLKHDDRVFFSGWTEQTCQRLWSYQGTVSSTLITRQPPVLTDYLRLIRKCHHIIYASQNLFESLERLFLSALSRGHDCWWTHLTSNLRLRSAHSMHRYRFHLVNLLHLGLAPCLLFLQ